MHRHDDAMVCTACGRRDEPANDDSFVTTAEQEDDDVVEPDPDTTLEGRPRTDDIECETCGNEEAWYTFKQTGAADEAPTRFFECTDCGARWREYN